MIVYFVDVCECRNDRHEHDLDVERYICRQFINSHPLHTPAGVMSVVNYAQFLLLSVDFSSLLKPLTINL